MPSIVKARVDIKVTIVTCSHHKPLMIIIIIIIINLIIIAGQSAERMGNVEWADRDIMLMASSSRAERRCTDTAEHVILFHQAGNL